MPSVAAPPSSSQGGILCRVRPWQWATALCGLVFLLGLGAYPLLDPDEGRYGEIPREMLQTGDWVIPTLNYVPYLEKPPLLYWISAAFMGALGEAEWVVRLVPALLGLWGLAVAWWLARLTVGAEAARWAPGVLGTMALYFAIARVPLTDMLVSVTLAASLTAWWSAELKTGAPRWRMLAVAGVLLGLAVLSKGLVAIILFGAVTVITLAWSKRLGAFLGAVALPVLISLAVNVPWWLAAQARFAGFAHFYFIVQHLNRFLGHDFNEHRRPPGYFVAMAIVGCGFWSVFWPQMLSGSRRAWRALEPSKRSAVVFLSAWALVVIGFFSLSSSQLATYTLPAWWPLAVCTAACVHGMMGDSPVRRSARWSLGLTAGVLLLVVAAALVLPGGRPEFPGPAIRMAQAVLGVSGVLAAAAFLLAHRLRDAEARMALLVCAAALFLVSLLPATAAIGHQRDMGALVPPQLRPFPAGSGWAIAQYKCYEQSLNYYTHSRIVLVAYDSELSMGPDQPDAAQWFPKDDGAIARLSARGPLALVTWPKFVPDFCRRYGLTVWGEGYKRTMLINKAGMEWLRQHP